MMAATESLLRKYDLKEAQRGRQSPAHRLHFMRRVQALAVQIALLALQVLRPNRPHALSAMLLPLAVLRTVLLGHTKVGLRRSTFFFAAPLASNIQFATCRFALQRSLKRVFVKRCKRRRPQPMPNGVNTVRGFSGRGTFRCHQKKKDQYLKQTPSVHP